jgi:SAM-dependent methyltransferase
MTTLRLGALGLQRLKHYAESSFEDWVNWEIEQFLSLLPEPDIGLRLLDLGCGDTQFTQRVASELQIPPENVVGVDAFDSEEHEIRVVAGNLNDKLPFDDSSFDVVISHFSLEHLYNPALFLKEIFRVLTADGCAVVGTDNLAAWPNILSLVFGWQPFSSTHSIGESRCGNPLALRSSDWFCSEEITSGDTSDADAWRSTGEFSHNKVLAYRGMMDAYEEAGFVVEAVRGAGYFPFKGSVAKFAAKADRWHAHFVVTRIRK